ncbi:MAG: TIGR00282 family metallophosphoesterase [Oscillospiraceae bacterium]
MKLLFIGDVVGKKGCDMIITHLYNIKKKYNIDITVINGENSAIGNGITRESADILFRYGADIITTGNHVYKRHEAADMLENNDMIIRPANYPDGCAGKGMCILDMGRVQIAVINLMGTVYMDALDNPFNVIDSILENIKTPNIFVDFHAEATAEKKCMGYYLEKRVTGVFGTHTHVQTADETILGGHTAYITDAGMTGAEESVLGVCRELAIEKMKMHRPVKFIQAQTAGMINGVIVEFDEKTGKSQSIKRLIYR